MEDQQFAYVLTGVRLDPTCSPFTTFTPQVVVDKGPGVDSLRLAEAVPVGGHWYGYDDDVLIGSDGTPERRLTLYPGDPDAIRLLADLYERAGGTVRRIALMPGWEREYDWLEYFRLTGVDKMVATMVWNAQSPEFVFRMMAKGLKMDEVIKAIMETRGDEAGFVSKMEELEAAVNPDDTLDGMLAKLDEAGIKFTIIAI